MSRLWTILLFVAIPLFAGAQQNEENNRKGDEAMSRGDYRNARMWYSENVGSCDLYSIEKLTDIWLINEIMRPSMRSLMNRCHACLTEKANNNDTKAISLLITYYKEGIGIQKDEGQIAYWTEQLELQRIPSDAVSPFYPVTITPTKPEDRMRFFAGYAFSSEAPFGITAGLVHGRYGGYVRLKSNFSFKESDYECFLENGKTQIKNPPSNQTFQVDKNKSNKPNTLLVSAGLVYKVTSWLYTSVGVGYGERTLYTPFKVENYDFTKADNIWCKNIDETHKGAVVELDVMIPYKSFYLSAGCHSLNFEYADVNAGIGFFF